MMNRPVLQRRIAFAGAIGVAHQNVGTYRVIRVNGFTPFPFISLRRARLSLDGAGICTEQHTSLMSVVSFTRCPDVPR
ncbi:hypothetical protein PSAB6_250113 [Paraburkholderia sabiae]|nr:hypothetical protein PSAB6_250113 [Paraburkholderia sabiae]